MPEVSFSLYYIIRTLVSESTILSETRNIIEKMIKWYAPETMSRVPRFSCIDLSAIGRHPQPNFPAERRNRNNTIIEL